MAPNHQQKISARKHAFERPISNRSQSLRESATGLRIVAIFEATKGVLVLLVGLELLSIVHRSAQNVGEEIVERFHLNLAHHHPRILSEVLRHLDNSNLRLLAVAALAYSTVRFVESYGLWRMRAWAEWFAILSGGVYLPFEVYELIRHPTTVKAVVLLINIGIVAYLIYFRSSRREEEANRT